MAITAPSLKELARACLARHHGAARPPWPAGVQRDFGGDPAAGWDARDYCARFEERAAIGEHDGGLPRAEAEARAFESAVVEWLHRNPPEQADLDRCIECGEPLGAWGVLPCLIGGGEHVRLHGRCHPAWMQRRRAAAVAALLCLGLHQP